MNQAIVDEEAFNRLDQAREPPIIHLRICYMNSPGHPPYMEAITLELCHRQQRHPQQYLDLFDQAFDTAVWRRYGESAGASVLERVGFTVEEAGLPVTPEAARCLNAFFMGFKEKESLNYFLFQLDLITAIDQVHLRYFFQNFSSTSNTGQGWVNLDSKGPVSLIQSSHISAALRDLPLRVLYLSSKNYMNDESYEQILFATRKVRKFSLSCSNEDQFLALAKVLRDPEATLQELSVHGKHELDVDVNLAEKKILESLARNVELKKLDVSDCFDRESCFANVLLDKTSLQSICNSNHTLQEIKFSAGYSSRLARYKREVRFCEEYLKMNKHQDKRKAVQHKVMHCYSSGLNDASILASLPLNILPHVLSIEVPNKQGALFNILKSLPELTDVSSREVVLSSGTTSTGRTENKRLKLGI